MAQLELIRDMVTQNHLDYSHYTLARFVSQVIPQASTLDLQLLILVSNEIGQGNGCLNIDSIGQKSAQLEWNDAPAKKELLQHIASSALIGRGDAQTPLVFDLDKLYLNRYFYYEKSIARRLLSMVEHHGTLGPQQVDAIDRVFARSADIDMQKLAAIIGNLHQLCIISGGPGTGKTWTVGKLLALLLMQQPNANIQLAAPTGKAATRLSESIAALHNQIALDESLRKRLPLQARTLHRLLGIHRYTHQPRYHRSHPLDCDVLVVDEASMIDLQLMAQLCEAIPEHCKLILLGDKDQLSSVEAGSVFADLCGTFTQTRYSPRQRQWCITNWDFDIPAYDGEFALADQLVVLNKSRRFDDDSAIGQLANWINQGDSDSCLKLLTHSRHADTLCWRQLADNQIVPNLQHQAIPMALSLTQADTIEQAFARFHQYQIVCAVWKGPAGVDTINAQLESAVTQSMSIAPGTDLYAGKPLMMTANAYEYDIHNGDIGILWPDEDDDLKVWFQLGEKDYRVLSLAQCPQHQTAYAMTVHKSQGSEFARILLILPTTEVAVSTRELFYTAVTRASHSVEIWAREDIITRTVEQKTQRVSGLMQRLQQG